jgi:hypothetical protein
MLIIKGMSAGSMQLKWQGLSFMRQTVQRDGGVSSRIIWGLELKGAATKFDVSPAGAW